ncbi:MAG: GlsB/YeaQ/YmgE family stress response membrane protein [Sphingomonadaceae bacterium]
MGSWIGIIVIGFLAGLIARFFASDPKNPSGCLATTVLGVIGAAVFTWLGQQLNFYAEGERAGFLGAVLGAMIVLAIWQALVERRR